MTARFRPPTLRLSSLMEVVAAVALCLFLERVGLTRVSPSPPAPSLRLRLVVGPILTGLALAGGLGLAIEAIAGRRPSTWGLGRWIWSISGIYAALWIASTVASQSARVALLGERVPWMGVSIWARSSMGGAFLSQMPWMLAAACATATFAGSPRDPDPDAREWSGRIFASLVIAGALGAEILHVFGL